MAAELVVWCMDQQAGIVRDAREAMTFAYDPGWIDAGRPPLSHSLPFDVDPSAPAVRAFFGGLLPEAAPRDMLARQLGVSVGNEFALLEQIGGDCAGAVSLLPPGEQPGSRPGAVTWLADEEVAQLVDELPQRPMHADESGEFRLSLAGAQDKLPVVVDPESGQIGLTTGRQPSTHVLKTPIAGLPATVLNEAFCLALGEALDVGAVRAEPRRVAGRELLLVERYDREVVDGVTQRLHQEDVCQALGVPSERKYQREGGPGLADCFALVDAVATVPARGKQQLLDAWALSFLVGNHDAHGKNISLLYAHEQTAVAPIYDVLSSVVYRKVKPMDRKMAMHVGGEYRPAYLRPRHLDRLLHDAGVSPRLARRRLVAFADRADRLVMTVRARFEAELWWEPFLDAVVETVEQRAGWLRDLCVAPAAVPERSQRSAAGQTSR